MYVSATAAEKTYMEATRTTAGLENPANASRVSSVPVRAMMFRLSIATPP